jgi:hypothetical protein
MKNTSLRGVDVAAAAPAQRLQRALLGRVPVLAMHEEALRDALDEGCRLGFDPCGHAAGG